MWNVNITTKSTHLTSFTYGTCVIKKIKRVFKTNTVITKKDICMFNQMICYYIFYCFFERDKTCAADNFICNWTLMSYELHFKLYFFSRSDKHRPGSSDVSMYPIKEMNGLLVVKHSIPFVLACLWNTACGFEGSLI